MEEQELLVRVFSFRCAGEDHHELGVIVSMAQKDFTIRTSECLEASWS